MGILRMGFTLAVVLACAGIGADARGQEQEIQNAKARMEELAVIQSELTGKQADLDRLQKLGDPWVPGAEKRRESMQRLERDIATLQARQRAAREGLNAALEAFRKSTAKLEALRKRALKTREYVSATAKDDSNRVRALETIDRDLPRLSGAELPALANTLDTVHGLLLKGRPIELIGKDLEEMVKANPALKGVAAQFNDILKDLVQVPIPDRPKVWMSRLGKLEKLFALLKNLAGVPAEDPTKSGSMESLTALVDFMKELTPEELSPAKGYFTMMLASMESIGESLKKLKLELAAKNLDMLEIVAGYEAPLPVSQQPYPKELFGLFEPLTTLDPCLVGTWEARDVAQFAGYRVTFTASGTQTVDYTNAKPLEYGSGESITWAGIGTDRIATKNGVATILESRPGSVTMTLKSPVIPNPVVWKLGTLMGLAGLGSTTGDNKYVCTRTRTKEKGSTDDQGDTLTYQGSTHRERHPNYAVKLTRVKH